MFEAFWWFKLYCKIHLFVTLVVLEERSPSSIKIFLQITHFNLLIWVKIFVFIL